MRRSAEHASLMDGCTTLHPNTSACASPNRLLAPPSGFTQVIIERMDRLRPGSNLLLKVASIMGQWVDLDILHKFYPINKTKCVQGWAAESTQPFM